MQGFKINFKRKDSNKRDKDNKKLSKLWLHLLILSLKIKNSKSDQKTKKCSDIYKINSKNKKNNNKEKLENNKSKNSK